MIIQIGALIYTENKDEIVIQVKSSEEVCVHAVLPLMMLGHGLLLDIIRNLMKEQLRKETEHGS